MQLILKDAVLRTCSKCQIEKPLEGFGKDPRLKSGHRAACIKCMSSYGRNHRKGREHIYAATSKAKWDRNRSDLWKLKEGACLDCNGTFHPCAMDFDHREGVVKLFDIATHFHRKSRDVILAEIAKCDLVCANCHRVRTFKRALTP